MSFAGQSGSKMMSLSINSTWRVELFLSARCCARGWVARHHPNGRVIRLASPGGKLSFELGFWTRRQDRQVYRLGNDPSRIVRRKCDFVRRLPGHGRRSLVGLLANKVVRRLTPDPFI